MAHEPFVSVVVPTYNRKDALKDCLDSLFNQSYPPETYEVIVIDDGSTDGTKEFLRGYSQRIPRLKYFTQSNKGPAAARNLGIRNSSGEIVCFTDDDCIADKEWIKNLVKAYADDKVGCVGGKILPYKPTTLLENYSHKTGILDQKKFSDEIGPVITSNTSYSKQILLDLKGFDENLNYGTLNVGEDLDLGIRAKLKLIKFVYPIPIGTVIPI